MTGMAPADSVIHSIKDLMRERKISQEQLAEHLGKTQQFVSRRISGEVDFSVRELFSVAGFLGVEPASLLVSSSVAVPSGGGGPVPSTASASGLVTPAGSPVVEGSVPGGGTSDPAAAGDTSAA